jgi:hypothetical protein
MIKQQEWQCQGLATLILLYYYINNYKLYNIIFQGIHGNIGQNEKNVMMALPPIFMNFKVL